MSRFIPKVLILALGLILAGGSPTRLAAFAPPRGDNPAPVASGSTSDPRAELDAPADGSDIASSFTVTGWAVDLGASEGTGIDAVHVWAFPITGDGFGDATFLGAADLSISRPDIADAF